MRFSVCAIIIVGAVLPVRSALAQVPAGLAAPEIDVNGPVRLNTGETQDPRQDRNTENNIALASNLAGRVFGVYSDDEPFIFQIPLGAPSARFVWSTNSANSFPFTNDRRFRGALLPPGTDEPIWASGEQLTPFAAADLASGDIWLGGVAIRGFGTQFSPYFLVPAGIFITHAPNGTLPGSAQTRWVEVNESVAPPCPQGGPCPSVASYSTPQADFGPPAVSDGVEGVLYVAATQMDVIFPNTVFQQARLRAWKSLDRGATWASILSPPVIGVLNEPPNAPWSAAPTVMPSGRLTITYTNLLYPGKIESTWTDDEGSTWQGIPAVVSAQTAAASEFTIAGFNTGSPPAVPSLYPAVAKSPLVRAKTWHDIFVVYPNLVSEGGGHIRRVRLFVRRSIDGGATWGAPLAVPFGFDATGKNNRHSDQFAPAVAIDALGGVNITWWQSDAPDNSPGPHTYSLWYLRIHDFGTAQQLIQIPRSNPLQTVNTDDYFPQNPWGLGAYQRMSAAGQKVYVGYPSVLSPGEGPGPLKAVVRRIDLVLP